ncbi:hypothetical protein L083_4167 [Actinoplanes sp. N902-109]|nr:hypothetical protein L083_4167 [Actinoplanes sp. N902-109]
MHTHQDRQAGQGDGHGRRVDGRDAVAAGVRPDLPARVRLQ